MSSSSEGKMSFTDFRFAVNLATFISRILATTLNVALHGPVGERYCGLPGLLAVPMLMIYASTFCQNSDSAPVVMFLIAYIVACLFWRTYTLYRDWRLLPPIHTRTSGESWLHRLMPTLSDRTVKKIEPFLVAILGTAVLSVNVPLGAYLMIAAAAQALSLRISLTIERAKLLDGIDAMIEQAEQAAEMNRRLGR